MADESGRLEVEVVYALPRRAWRAVVRLAPGSTVADAIEASGLERSVPGLVVEGDSVGVFAQPVALSTALRDGDRVEIYRPLRADPKVARRERAAGRAPRRG